MKCYYLVRRTDEALTKVCIVDLGLRDKPAGQLPAVPLAIGYSFIWVISSSMKTSVCIPGAAIKQPGTCI